MMRYILSIILVLILILINPNLFAEDSDPLLDRGPLDVLPLGIGSNFRLGHTADSIDTLHKDIFKVNFTISHANYWGPYAHFLGDYPDYSKETIPPVSYAKFPLLDAEITQYVFKLRYGLEDRIEIGIDFRLMWYGGGFLDSVIEGFHSFTGLKNADREHQTRNSLVLYDYAQGRINWQPGLDFNDITLYSKFQVRPGFLSFVLAMRIPIHSIVSGIGFLMALQSKPITVDDIDIYFTFGLTFHENSNFFLYNMKNNEGHIKIALKFRFEPEFALVVQFQMKTPGLLDVPNFSVAGYEAVLGFQWQVDNSLLQLAIIENGFWTFWNEPDIAFQFSFSFFVG